MFDKETRLELVEYDDEDTEYYGDYEAFEKEYAEYCEALEDFRFKEESKECDKPYEKDNPFAEILQSCGIKSSD